MFDYQVSKHPHFDEACRAFALRHNLVQLAERAGMNVQILRNKLNPAQPHLLTAPEIWLLTDLTEDSTLVCGVNLCGVMMTDVVLTLLRLCSAGLLMSSKHISIPSLDRVVPSGITPFLASSQASKQFIPMVLTSLMAQ
ncbi:phage regulatory CII family protein [Escherichia coli]|uniref:phage regulatory CII family protein n=1 Tax=Escherichia coli TaxID=562 RepID=UPI000B093D6A|nr:phage regulatory CII family protein [Escherichia coli]